MVITSSGLRGDAARCRELGIAAYLSKPIKQSLLLDAIMTVLGTTEPAGAEPPLGGDSGAGLLAVPLAVGFDQQLEQSPGFLQLVAGERGQRETPVATVRREGDASADHGRLS